MWFQWHFLLIGLAIGNNYANTSPSKLTWASDRSKADSIVLSEPFEKDMPYFTRIEIFRNGKPIFAFRDSTAEIDGSGDLFIEHMIGRWPNFYLIFRCSGRPQVDYFLVLQKSEKGYVNIGYTPSSSAEILGDIDYDGEFEIGGFENLHEAGDTDKEVCASLKREYKIFEVKKGFPVDSKLMKTMLPLVLEKCLKKPGLKK
jgi:hypothetical protein